MIGLLLAITAGLAVEPWVPGLVFHPVEPCRVVDTRVETIITCHPDNAGICTHYIPGLAAFIVAGDETRVAYKDRGGNQFPFTFADQGGKPGGCGIPRDAKAAMLNVAVSSIHIGPGHIRLWKFGLLGYHPWNGSPIPTKPPKASVLNWPKNHCERNFFGPSSIHCTKKSLNWYANGVTVGICDPETAPFEDCNEDILIKPFGGAVRVIVDVYGYYTVE